MSYCMICVQPYDNRDGSIGHPICVQQERLVEQDIIDAENYQAYMQALGDVEVLETTRARLEQQVKELEAKVENLRDRIPVSYDEFFGGGYI